jgi:hypothetical protein
VHYDPQCHEEQEEEEEEEEETLCTILMLSGFISE